MGRTNAERTDVRPLKVVSFTDPSTNEAVSTSVLDTYSSVLITTTGASNAQTLQTPTNTTENIRFTVINNDTSTDSITINGVALSPGNTLTYIRDGSAWTTEGAASGTVTSVGSGNGMDFTAITSSGDVTMGTPGTLTSATSNGVTATSHTHDITTGIADTNILRVDQADAASGEYAKLTANGIESKSFAEVKTDLSLNNVENTALSTWAGSSNITTLGTISTGTWNGTDIDVPDGGSGRGTATAYAVLCGGTTATGAHQSIAGLGTSGQVLTSNGAGALPTMQDAGGGGGTSYILIQDQKFGSHGGASVAGSWQARVLNTEVVDTGGDATLSSNQITLTAGTYRYRITSPFGYVGRVGIRLYNISDTALVSDGICGNTTSTSGNSNVVVMGRFTIASSKTFGVDYYCSVSTAIGGLGNHSGSATSNYYYTTAEFWKEL